MAKESAGVPIIAPVFATSCEIKTLTEKGQPASMVILRFLYNEKWVDEHKKPMQTLIPVATVLLPRQHAKDFMKKFYAVMSAEDEYPAGPKSV